MEDHYAKILLPPMFNLSMDGPAKGAAETLPDNYISLLVEELIANNVTKIAVPPDEELIKRFSSLPDCYNSKVIVLDEDSKVLQKVQCLLEPVGAEANLKVTGPRSYQVIGNRGHELENDIGELSMAIYRYLLASYNSCQFVGNIEHLKCRLARVRKGIENPEGRILLTHFEGILKSYEQQDLPTIKAKPNASKESVDALFDLINDRVYLDMSKKVFGLGFPNKPISSYLKTKSREICRSEKFHNVVNYGSRMISAVTQAPIPNADEMTNIIPGKYLPPFVSIKDCSQEVLKQL